MAHLLFEDHFRGALGEDGDAAFQRVQTANDGAHGLTLRVEGKDLQEGVLGPLLSNVLERCTDVLDEAQEGAFRLVAELSWQFVGLFGRLNETGMG